MITSSPISQNQRTPIIDILRGWALLSVTIQNYSGVYGWNNHAVKTEPNNLTTTVETVTEIIFGSKGWTLLAILFGFGFSALLKKISENQQSTYLFFIKRMFWLFVFAFMNSLFYGGDILNDYAFLGIVLLLFYRLNSRALFIVGIVILLATPLLQSYLGSLHVLFAPKDRDTFYELYNRHTLVDHIKANLFMRYKWLLRLSYSVIFHLVQLGYLLIGAAMHRSGFLLKTINDRKTIRNSFFVSLVLSVAIYYLQALIEKREWNFNKYYNLFYIQVLCSMMAVTTGIIWLYVSGKLKRLFAALKVIGKMTLTNYITQNIILFFVLVCYKPAWDLIWYLVLAIVVFILQVLFSQWWLKKYNYGLLEWVWRCLSYGRRIQFKK